MSTVQAVRPGKPAPSTGMRRLVEKYFYFGMSLLIAVIIVYGFSHTVDANLLHPAVPRPGLLWLHGIVFSAWVAFFIIQSALIRIRKVSWHRLTGWFGAALGTVIPILGVATAITMAHFEVHQLHADPSRAGFVLIPFLDMLCFTPAFWLAVYLRKKPEYHKRLVFVASCALTAAAFFRFPEQFPSHTFFYAGVDLLIALGVVRDLIVSRRVHRVYLIALPAIAAAQVIVMYLIASGSALWLKIATAIVG